MVKANDVPELHKRPASSVEMFLQPTGKPSTDSMELRGTLPVPMVKDEQIFRWPLSGTGRGSGAPWELRVRFAGKLASREIERGPLALGTTAWIPTPGQPPGARQSVEPRPSGPSSGCGTILEGRVNITFLDGLRCFC